MSPSKPRIVVVGSINMDLVVRCGKLPMPGETVLAQSSRGVCGGKGANQAVAAARAGGEVTMVGRVGDDAFAGRLVENLRREGVQTDHVLPTGRLASGLAVVAVEDSGQNAILVVPGANGRVSVDDVRAARSAIESADVVLLQLEIPIKTVLATIDIARSAGVRVVLDPAPVPARWPDELLEVDLLTPNESEAAALVGRPVESIEEAKVAARKLNEKDARNVAITLGDRGTLLFDEQQTRRIEPFAVEAVDTTAAGDAFAGALAVFWAERDDLAEAVRLANAAGALAASREGAQPGMASREEIENLRATSPPARTRERGRE